jgi:hypothetical protein
MRRITAQIAAAASLPSGGIIWDCLRFGGIDSFRWLQWFEAPIAETGVIVGAPAKGPMEVPIGMDRRIAKPMAGETPLDCAGAARHDQAGQ